MGFFNRGYETIKVVGSLTPMLGRNVEEKKAEKIASMERQGYQLISCTGRQICGEGFIGGLMGNSTIEYTLVFKKP